MSPGPGPPAGRLRRQPPPPPPAPPSRLARPSAPPGFLLPRLLLALLLGLTAAVGAGAAVGGVATSLETSESAEAVARVPLPPAAPLPPHRDLPLLRNELSFVPSTKPPLRVAVTTTTTTRTPTPPSTPPPPPSSTPRQASPPSPAPTPPTPKQPTSPAPTLESSLPANTTPKLPTQPLLNLTLGYLPACKGSLPDRQCMIISGAITYALEQVNNDSLMLPWVRLNLRWNDTQSTTVTATRAITEMVCEGIAAIFGPEGFCHVESIVTHSWNIPMFSFHCSDEMDPVVTTFIRTEPPNKQVIKSILALLKYYDWKKFAILWEPAWESVAKSLMRQAAVANVSITHEEVVFDKGKCCAEELKCCYKNVWYQTISVTRNITRIYVFLGQPTTLLDMMKQMNDMKLFDHGEYLVITADLMPYTHRDTLKFIWDLTERNKSCDKVQTYSRSLFIVGSTPPHSSNYSNFAKKVEYFNTKEPFYFSVPEIMVKNKFEKKITIYAAYLYDALKLYAQSLHDVLLEHHQRGEEMTAETIERLAKNGTDIINVLKEKRTYKSITGAEISIDDNGDSEGNFSVIAMVPEPMHDSSMNYNCNFHFRPIGTFSRSGKDKLEYNVNGTPWWIGNGVPLDEPSCGFHHEHCLDDSRTPSKVAAATLAVLLFCAGVVTLSIYRKWKIEQEIEGLLWKIDRSDVHGFFGNDIVSSPSRMSLASAASCESRCGQQMFAPTATYRSVTIRIKELKFSRRKDISREIMKEMRLLRDLRHDNINSFIGACIEPMSILLITDYCAKGSLYDIVENEDLKLDKMFISSLVHDLIKGMIYIHKSALGCHGNLKSSNCVVTSRWVLQLTDFGLHELRHSADNSGSIGDHQHYRSLFWKAPELLRDPTGTLLLGRDKADVQAVQKADVYAFAIVLYEMFGKKGPYGGCPWEPKEIIDSVKRKPIPEEKPFRPDLSLLDMEDTPCEDFVIDCIQDCWSEAPENRPDFPSIRTRLRPLKEGSGRHRNIMDQMMEIMEKYAENLEALVNERTRQLAEEKRKTVDLLNRMLPAPVADQLTKGFGVEPESFETVTIYFSDIVGFTAMSAESSPFQVVNFLNDLYTLFDRIIKGYDVYKVETIGDAYMVVSGLPLRNEDRNAGEIASMSLDLLEAVKNHRIAHRPNDILKLRIGIHTGPVVAGVVGLTMPRYCLFGDTVNTASRMESTGEPLRIHISPQCRTALDKLGGYLVEERGLVALKGKGEVCTYWLTGATERAVQRREVALDEMPPPLFCRPRRSPRLCAESRQASSLCAAPGSRRHSSAPRTGSGGSAGGGAMAGDSPATGRSQRSGSSPEHALLKNCRLVDTSPLYLGGRADSLATLTVDGDCSLRSSRDLGLDSDLEDHEEEEIEARMSPALMVPRMALPFDKRLLAALGRAPLRETRSLDPFPAPPPRRSPRRDSRSLENCVDACPSTHVNTAAGSLLRQRSREGYGSSRGLRISRGVVPNGDARLAGGGGGAGGGRSGGGGGGGNSSAEDVQAPLLLPPAGAAGSKRWRSLEVMAPDDTAHPALPSNGFGKKALARGSIRSWLVGLFHGNGLRPDPASALRNGLGGYSDLQGESLV